MNLTEFSEYWSLFEMFKKRDLRFGHFSAFFELWTAFHVFWPFLGTVVKNTKDIKVSGNFFSGKFYSANFFSEIFFSEIFCQEIFFR